MPQKAIKALETQLGHSFKDKELLTAALTHPSTGDEDNYERLEYL